MFFLNTYITAFIDEGWQVLERSYFFKNGKPSSSANNSEADVDNNSDSTINVNLNDDETSSDISSVSTCSKKKILQVKTEKKVVK